MSIQRNNSGFPRLSLSQRFQGVEETTPTQHTSAQGLKENRSEESRGAVHSGAEELPSPAPSFWGRLRQAVSGLKTYGEVERDSSREGFGGGKAAHQTTEGTKLASEVGVKDGKLRFGGKASRKLSDRTELQGSLGLREGEVSFGTKAAHVLNESTKLGSELGFEKGRFNLGANATRKLDENTNVGGGLSFRDGKIGVNGRASKKHGDYAISQLAWGGGVGSLSHTRSAAETERKWGRDTRWERSVDNGVTTESTKRTTFHGEKKLEDKQLQTTGTALGPKPKDRWRDRFKIPVDVALAQASEGVHARAGVSYVERSSSDVLGSVGVAGAGHLYSEALASADAGARLTTTGVDATISADTHLHLLGAEGEVIVASPQTEIAGEQVDLHMKLTGRTFVGADSRPYVTVALAPWPPKAILEGSGGVFVGARAEGEVELGLGEVLTFRAVGEAWAGAGIEGEFVASFDDGKLKLGFGGGAALKVGGKLGGQVEVDIVKIGKMAKQAADVDGDSKISLNDPATLTARGIEASGGMFEKAVDGVIRGLDGDGNGRFSLFDLQVRTAQAGRAVSGLVAEGTQAVGAGLSAAGAGLLHGVDALGDGIHEAGQSIRSLSKAGEHASLTEHLQSGLQTLEQKAHDVVDVDRDGRLSARDLVLGTRQAAEALREGVQVVVEGTGRGVEAVVDGAVEIGKSVGAAVTWSADKAEDVAKGTWEAGRDAARWTTQKAKAGAAWTGQRAHELADRDGDGRLELEDVRVGAQEAGALFKEGKDFVLDKTKAAGRWAHSKSDLDNDGKLGLHDLKIAGQESLQMAKKAKDATVKGVRQAGRWTHAKIDLDDDGKIGLGDVKVAAGEIKHAAVYVKEKARVVRHEIGRQFTQAGSTISDATTRTYLKAQSAVGRLVRFFGG